MYSASTIDTDRKRQRLTRSQENRIRNVFPFLDLPGEIRNVIYEYALDTDVAQRLIQRYYERARHTTDKMRSTEAPLVWARAPPLFLLNKQIYHESNSIVPKRGITFDHGLLDLMEIQDFVPESLLRTVSSITINDSGHPLLQDNIIAQSWMGYITLLEQLADILSKGHNLKTLTISLANSELVPHVTTCWNASFGCGFRDTLKKACETLRRVRKVGSVTLHGIPERLAFHLKAHMESTPVTFFDLPREIRNMIYAEAADWSDISKQLSKTMKSWVDKTSHPAWPARTTPTVLLLNKQITAEAITVICKKPLVVDCPSDHGMQPQTQVPIMLELISPFTLKFVKHLVLNVNSWEWVYSLDHFLPHLASYNISCTSKYNHVTLAQHTSNLSLDGSPSPSTNDIHPCTIIYPTLAIIPALESLHLHFTDILKGRFLLDKDQRYPDTTLHLSLSGLAKIRGLQRVSFSGDLPHCYTNPLGMIMQAPCNVSLAALPRLMAIKGTGEVVDIEKDGL